MTMSIPTSPIKPAAGLPVLTPDDFRRERRAPPPTTTQRSRRSSSVPLSPISLVHSEPASAFRLDHLEGASSSPFKSPSTPTHHTSTRHLSHEPHISPRDAKSSHQSALSDTPSARRRSVLQEEAARSWDSYAVRRPSIGASGSLTIASLANTHSLSASAPPTPAATGPITSSMLDEVLCIQPTVERPNRRSGSLHSMLSYASLRQSIHYGGSDEATEMLLSAAVPNTSASDTTFARLRDRPALLPETRNELSASQRREQLRRAQKLASLLGGEVLSDGEERELVKQSKRSGGIPNMMRRQSDPVHLPFRSLASSSRRPSQVASDSEQHEGVFKSKRSKLLLRRRSTTLLEANTKLAQAALPVERLPPNVGPKAAALLGLDRLDAAATASPPTSAQPKRRIRPHSFIIGGSASYDTARYDSLRSRDGSSPLPTEAPYANGLRLPPSLGSSARSSSFDAFSASATRLSAAPSSSEEIEDDGLGRESLEILADVVPSIVQSDGEGDEPQTADTVSSACPPAAREERRRRVAKISKWLGAVVPPHLVADAATVSAPGYGADNTPLASSCDYFSGAPQEGSTEGSSSGSVGLGRAKAATLARLKRATTPQLSPNDVLSPGASPADGGASSPRDHFANVKKAQTLAKRFGEAPPRELYARPLSPGPAAAPPARSTHAHSASLSGLSSFATFLPTQGRLKSSAFQRTPRSEGTSASVEVSAAAPTVGPFLGLPDARPDSPVATPEEERDDPTDSPPFRRGSVASLSTLDSGPDSSPLSRIMGLGDEDDRATHTAHRAQAARAQKLSRFLGEEPSDFPHFLSVGKAGVSTPIPSPLPLEPQSPTGRHAAAAFSQVRPMSLQQRLAPRSAGSAQRRKPTKSSSDSIEDELNDLEFA